MAHKSCPVRNTRLRSRDDSGEGSTCDSVSWAKKGEGRDDLLVGLREGVGWPPELQLGRCRAWDLWGVQ